MTITRNRHEKINLSTFLFHPRQIWVLIRKSAGAWVDDYAPSMGAALAYYTLFAIAPLLIIAIAAAGLVFGREAARGEIVSQIQGLIGREGAIAVQGLLKSTHEPAQNLFATVVSIITLIIGATTVFAELQSDLDRIWRVPAPAKENGIWILLRTHLLSFGLVLGLGFLLLVSLLVSASIAAFGKWSSGFFEGWEALLFSLNFIISFVITMLLFAMIYKFMPRARIAWRDVWIGAAVTAFLFEIGKFLIGLYLGKTSVASGFGAAGSLVVLLVWVYFSAQIFLLGAEFTWVYSHEYGSKADQTGQKSVLAVPSRSDGAAAAADVEVSRGRKKRVTNTEEI
ncbi:MAG: YihY/virulence factor BrkB family protein [Nitrospirae bacterium]|nr:YihY/virulence factor BrkB family protein [Nitrospirota bacterium]